MSDDPKPKRVPTKEQAEVAHDYLCEVIDSDALMRDLCNEVIREYLASDLRVINGYIMSTPAWATQPYTVTSSGVTSGFSQVLDNPRPIETP